MWWAPHRLGCLPSGRQAAADYTVGNLAHKMPTGHLSWNAEDTADSNGPRHRHRRCGFAGVWLGNLENIQLGYKGYRSSPLLHGFRSGRTSAPLARGLGSAEGVGGASSPGGVDGASPTLWAGLQPREWAELPPEAWASPENSRISEAFHE